MTTYQIIAKAEKKRILKVANHILWKKYPMGRFGGTSPVRNEDKYPLTTIALSLAFGLDFPVGADDSYPIEGQLTQEPGLVIVPVPNVKTEYKKEPLVPFVNKMDSDISDYLYQHGFTKYSDAHSWNRGDKYNFALAQMFPPMGGDARYDEEAAKYGRWMTEKERIEFEKREGRPPFTDEAWIVLRYAGINLFRVCELPAPAWRRLEEEHRELLYADPR